MLLTQPYFDKLGRQVVDQLRADLQSKNLTGFGPSVATGQLLDSIRYEATAEALRVYALDYIYYLEKGRKPGKRPPFDPDSTKYGVKVRGENKGKPRGDYPNISEWIESANRDGARARFSWNRATQAGKASIVAMIAGKIAKNGTTIFQKGGSDIVSGVVSDDLIRQIVTDIGGMFATQITKLQTLV